MVYIHNPEAKASSRNCPEAAPRLTPITGQSTLTGHPDRPETIEGIMKSSEIIMLAGVGLLGYAVFKNSAAAQTAAQTQLTPYQQANLNMRMQTAQGQRVQSYVQDAGTLLREITGGLTNGFSQTNGGTSSPSFNPSQYTYEAAQAQETANNSAGYYQ
jgi:hypothetical protein